MPRKRTTPFVAGRDFLRPHVKETEKVKKVWCETTGEKWDPKHVIINYPELKKALKFLRNNPDCFEAVLKQVVRTPKNQQS